MRYTLRPYQQEAVDKILWARGLEGNDIVCIPQGGGKSLIIANFVEKLGEPVLILCPTREILKQNMEKLSDYVDEKDIGVFSASMGRKDTRLFTLGTIQSVYKHPEEFLHFDVVIIDECIVKGTRVNNKKIENIKVGDYVDSFNHVTKKIERKKVLAVSKKELTGNLWYTKVRDSFIISTSNHPIFSNGEYKNAKNIAKGDFIYEKNTTTRKNKVFRLWGNNKKTDRQSKKSFQEIRKNILFKKMWSIRGWRQHIKNKKSSENSLFNRIQKKNVKKIESNRTQTTDSRRKRQIIIQATTKTLEIFRERMVCRTHNKNRQKQQTRLSTSLQNRHCQSYAENSDRSRWWFSWFHKKKEARQKETKIIRESRVVSSSIYQQRNKQKNGKNSNSKTYVYNLQVEGNNNYFANNILVHNCDLLSVDKPKSMYRNFLKQAEIKKVFGFTGTPWRMDTFYREPSEGWAVWRSRSYKKNLEVVTTTKMISRYSNGFWSRMLYVLNTKDLIKEGYLSPLKYVDETLVEHEKIPLNKSRSEFNFEKYEDDIVDEEGFIIDQIMVAKRIYNHILIFCVSIKQAETLSSYFDNSAVVTSKTKKKDREQIIKDFKSGKIKVVFNVSVLTVGFDFPELDCIFLLRPTKSLRLHLQILGRGARISESKKFCAIIDMSGNVKSLGRLEDIEVKRLSDGWNVVSPSQPKGFHMKELYSFIIK